MIAFATEPAGPARRPDDSRHLPIAARPSHQVVSMPTDLRSWFGVPTILAWIEQEMHALTREAGLAREADSSWTLLRTLAYAYATQVYASSEIAQECRTESVFRWLCRGAAPFGHEIQSFRRRNRPALEHVLRQVFLRAIQARFSLAAESIPRELQSDLLVHARERLNIARHLDAGDE